MMSSGKRKREEFPSQYQTSGYIPQQDGAGDPAPGSFELKVLSFHALNLVPSLAVRLFSSFLNFYEIMM